MMIINLITKNQLNLKKNKYLKKLDGVSVVININRKISFAALRAVGTLLCEGGRLGIGVCRFFIEHPTVSGVLISGVKGVFSMKKINALKWLPLLLRFVVGGILGYEVSSVKHQMGLHEILLETLKKDYLLGTVIDTNMQEQLAVAATGGLIALASASGVVEPNVISSSVMLTPYDAVKSVGKYVIMSAGTGGCLGGVTLGLMGLAIGSYLAPDLMSKTVSLSQKMVDKISSLNSIKVESWYEKVPNGFQEVEFFKPFVKRSFEVVKNKTEIELANLIINDVIYMYKISDFVTINNNYIIEVVENQDGLVTGFTEQLPDLVSTNEYTLRFDKAAVGNYNTVVDLVTKTVISKEEEVITKLVKKKVVIYDTCEKTKITPDEMSNYTNLFTKSYKYSSEMLKIYIDNYTLTEHLIIIGSVSLISYGIYRVIKNYLKSPESVIDPSKTD